MRWPEILNRDKEKVAKSITKVIQDWERKDERYRSLRYFSRDTGFSVLNTDFPAEYEKIPYSILKLKINNQYRYALRICEGNQEYSSQNKESNFSWESVVLLHKKNEGYSISDEHYEIKIIKPSYGACKEEKIKKKIESYATKVIQQWQKEDAFQEKQVYSKTAEFGEEQGTLCKQRPYSLVRYQIGDSVHYGLWLSEEDRRFQNMGEGYAILQRLKLESGRYRVIEKYVGVKRIENRFQLVDQIDLNPSEKDHNEANIMQIREMGGDIFSINDFTVIARKSCQGLALDQYVKAVKKLESTRNIVNFLKIMYSSCAEIKKTHQSRILHRDLKPSDILVNENLSVIISGFEPQAKKLEGESDTTEDEYVGAIFPIYQIMLQHKKDQGNSKLFRYGFETDVETLGRIFFSIFYDLQDNYFKLILQVKLMQLIIFAESPALPCIELILSQLEESINKINTIQPRALCAYNQSFVRCFKQQFASKDMQKLFALAQESYTNSSEKSAFRYNSTDCDFIQNQRQKLEISLNAVIQKTAIRLLQDYASVWTMIFALHWNRHHRRAVSQVLQQHSQEKLEVSELLKRLQPVLENQQGSLARRLQFICALQVVQSQPSANLLKPAS